MFVVWLFLNKGTCSTKLKIELDECWLMIKTILVVQGQI